jgi:hypothetical protein
VKKDTLVNMGLRFDDEHEKGSCAGGSANLQKDKQELMQEHNMALLIMTNSKYYQPRRAWEYRIPGSGRGRKINLISRRWKRVLRYCMA